jgi:hypothetical protein
MSKDNVINAIGDYPFNESNVNELSNICRNIDNLCKEAIDGQLMYSQLVYLGQLIKEFKDNPIINKSGII